MTEAEDTVDVERSNIDELRRRMKDLMAQEMYEDDNVFERFLRARDQNLDAAEAMLKNHVKWRKVHRVDTINTHFKPNEVLEKYDVISRIAFDKEGSPVVYVAFGNLDIKGGYKAALPSDYFKFFLTHLEGYVKDMKDMSKKLGKPINEWVMIFDYNNFSLANATYKPAIQFIIYLISMYEANYPERLKSAYLINGSFVFQLCFAMFKSLITGRTISKMNFFGSDFQNALLEIIDADQLPAFLGGNRTDPDGNPRCEQTVKFGGQIPEFYQMGADGGRPKPSTIRDAEMLVVNRFSKARVEVEVTKPGAAMEWRFTLKNKTIDFSVLYKEAREQGDSEVEEVIPQRRVEAAVSSESGTCCCERAGIYILEFDNSFSWLHSKHIYYSVNVGSAAG